MLSAKLEITAFVWCDVYVWRISNKHINKKHSKLIFLMIDWQIKPAEINLVYAW